MRGGLLKVLPVLFIICLDEMMISVKRNDQTSGQAHDPTIIIL